MYARSSIGPAIRRALVYLFAFVVEAILVVGLVILTLAPSTVGGQVGGPDRPPAPLVAPFRT
jgi:hypothetical protein